MADLFQEYDDIVKQAQQPAGLPVALYSAADTSPDAEATLQKLSRKTGIPVEGLRNDNGAEAKRVAAVNAVDNLHVTSPTTATFLSDPENAKISHDDIDSLAAIEKLARDGFGKPASVMGIATPNDQQAAKRAKSIGGAFVEGLITSPERVNQGMSTLPVMAADFVNWSLAAFPDETGMRQRFADRLRESPEFWKREAEAKMQKFAPQTAENYVQQAGSSIGTSLLAAPFGMAGQDAALSMFALFAEGGYQEMRDKGVSVPTAAALSVSNSAMEGLTEKIGLDQIYKGTGPILKKAIGFVMGDLAGEEINTLYNALVDKVTIKPDMSMSDVVQQVIDTAIVTAISGPVQGVTMSGASKVSEGLYSNMQARQQAQAQADFLNALGEGVKASKTYARLPEKVQELVRAAKEDGPITDVFIPVERFTELFQSQGMDARQVAEQILSDPTRYYEAVASGSDIAIPLEEFATLAGESYYQELVKNTKASVDGITMREAESFGQDQEKLVNDLLAQAADEGPAAEDAGYQTAYQQIYDDTYGQLIGVGRNPGQAEAEATVRAKGLAVLAQRYGYDPAELIKQFPITVTRGELPDALQRQAAFTAQQETPARSIQEAQQRSRATIGGQEGVNGYFYKGGQFLPSTMAEPGKWKIGGKWVKSGKAEIENNKWEHQPTPFSRSLYEIIRGNVIRTPEGTLVINPSMKDNSPDTEIRPGVKGVLSTESYSLQELIDAYNDGSRWIDVKPDAPTVTTIQQNTVTFIKPDGTSSTEDIAPMLPVDTLYQINPRSQAEWKKLTTKWMKKNGYSGQQIDAHLAAMEGQIAILSYLGPLQIEMFPTGANDAKKSRGPIRDNSDPIYKITFDASAMCVKRLEASATAAAIQSQLKRGLTTSERMALVAAFRERGKAAPCLYCYVEAPRAKMVEFTNKAIKVATGGNIQAGWSQSMKDMAQGAQDEIKKLGMTADDIDVNLFADVSYLQEHAEEMQQLKEKAPKAVHFIEMFSLGAKANLPKLYEEYDGQILNLPKDLISELNGYAGLRFFSTSDFQGEHVVDLMMAMIDMELVGAKSHAYTKTEEYVDVFGQTGQKIQMSIFANVDADGKITADTWQGWDWEKAKANRQKFKDVGTVLVATDERIVAWALEQDWIDYVIPFHHSGMESKFTKELKWQDFTGTQSEKPITPGAKAKKIRMHEVGVHSGMTDLKATEAYLKLAMNRKLIPVFPSFLFKDQTEVLSKNGKPLSDQRKAKTDRAVAMWKEMVKSGKIDMSQINPNYFKLKKDYARTDTPFKAVKAKFNMTAVKTVIDQFLATDGKGAKADQDIVNDVLGKIAGAKGSDIGLSAIKDMRKTLHQSAFHGSPHTFDKFSLSAIGTGEGAQAYGWGLYFASSKGVAEYYRDALSSNTSKNPMTYRNETLRDLDPSLVKNREDSERQAAHAVLRAHYDTGDSFKSIVDKQIAYLENGYQRAKQGRIVSPSADYFKEWLDAYKSLDVSEFKKRVNGRLYQVELAPEEDEYLLWDKPLSEQSEKVKAALIKALEKVIPSARQLILDGQDRAAGAFIYKNLAMDMNGSDKAASKYLHSLDIRGIKYLDGSSRGKGDGNYNYVIFDESDVAITMMEQRKADLKRGYIKFGDNVPGFEIGLLKDADSSTFIHELGHYYHEVLGRLAGQENAPEQLRADYDTLLKWLGATDKQSLTVEQSEKFARGFEAYLYEGNAPSQEMRGVFQRFKTWLKAVYSSLKSLNVELTDDVRQVFDRLLATDEEIQAAEKEQNVKPIFATAQDAGMSPAVFEAYRKLAEQAHEEAKDRLEQAKLKEIKRVQQQWYKDEREKLAAEIEAEAKSDPVYEAINFLYTGKLFDGSTFEGQEFKLSKAELLQMYDEATVKGIQKKLGWIYRKDGGISPAAVAEMFGFSSADEMIKRIMEAPKLKEYVKAETDKRMIEIYGEMNSAEIADAAINAVHNDEQAKLLREELKAINRKVKDVRPFLNAADRADRASRKEAFDSIPPIEFFREAAKRAIAAKKVSDLMPGVYSRAEQKAGKQAIELNGKGKYAEAAEAKQKQLLNHYLYREALQAREDADKIASYMRGLAEGKAQQRIGKAGQDYLEQVNAILDRYEFRRQTVAVLAERERLIDWMARKERETGMAPPIPPAILEDAQQVNYRTLTVAQLRDISDAVKVITHMARVEGKLLKDQEKQDIMDLADDAAASIEDNSKGTIPRKPEKNLPQDRPGALMENYFASHRKMSSLVRQMDGGKDGGVMWNLIIRPMNDAGDKEASMRADAAEKLSAIFGVYSALDRTKMHRREFIPEVNQSISKWGRLVVALNMGNEGNRQRLGVDFTPDEVATIVDALDERDWQFVQNVWDFINEYWPLIEAKEKRVYGVAPAKVIAMPVTTKFGTLAGGYYPIKYDSGETAKTGAQEEAEIYKQMMGGAFTKATTRHGHTEIRLEAVNRPLSLSIDTLFQHVNQVIHDLTHHEMLIDVNKLLGTTQIQNAIRDNYGMEAYKVLTDGIRDVAVGDIPAQNAFEKFMAYSRVGISTAGLGYNLVTSMMQPLGLTQSIVRIGPRWVGKGISRWISSPKHMIETAEWIYSKSEFMRLRGKTQNREIAEIRNQMTVGIIPNSVRDSFFYFIQQMQKTVDIPTWLGQYDKSMDAHGNESDAIAEADQAVIDSQASGMTKDLARIQRGGPLQKLFTTFYSFFSTTYNLAAESKGKTNFKNPSEVGRFMVDMLMLYTVPTVLVVALKEAVQRGIGGGDDDEEKLLKKLAGEQLGYIMGGFVGLRELSSMFSGFQGYEGPAGTRVYSESVKLAKEVGQGEWDEGLYKRLNSLGGILLHYPSTQVQRTTEGIIELKQSRGNLLSLFFGKPKK